MWPPQPGLVNLESQVNGSETGANGFSSSLATFWFGWLGRVQSVLLLVFLRGSRLSASEDTERE